MMTKRNELTSTSTLWRLHGLSGCNATSKTSRTKATERFVLGLREQVAPVMEEAQSGPQNWWHLNRFQEESLAI